MCVAKQALSLLEALSRRQDLAALLVAGVEEGCWTSARWRESDGAVTAQVGSQEGRFERHAFSLGWLEASPGLDQALVSALAPSLNFWLEGQWARRTTKTIGFWVELSESRFLSVYPTVHSLLGYTQDEFLGLPVPQSWLDALAATPQGQATLYLAGPMGQPIWLEVSWIHGTRSGQVRVAAHDATTRLAKSETRLEKPGLPRGWELDLRIGREQWAEEVSRIHGRPLDGQPPAELNRCCFPEPARRELEAAIERAVATGEPYELELPMVTVQGEHRWVRTTGLPIYEGDVVVKLHGMFKDVTPMMEARQELYRERSRLRTILDTIPDLVWLKCPLGRFLECNERFGGLMGAERANVLGKTDYDFFDQETADFFRHNDLLAMQASGPRRNEEWVHFRNDGHRELLETIKRPLYEEGRLVGVLGIARDLTENYNVRQRLEESQNRLRLFLENAPAAVAMLDRDLRYLLFSHRFARDYGLQSSDLFGRSHYEVFPELPQRWREVHQRCLSGAVERCQEDSFVRFDGSKEWLRWEVRPWYEAGGEVGGLILFSEVITAAKNAEIALRNSEERLRSAQRMEAVGRLAGGVAHDFNNLLTVVVSCAEMAKMDLGPDHPMGENLDEILTACKRGETLTRQLLTFSRHQVATLEALNLDGLVSGTLSMLARLVGEDIELTFHSADTPCWVLNDVGQMEQLLVNLVVNAREAMVSGGKIVLTLESRELESGEALALGLPPGRYARLRVSDTGCGMDEPTRLHIFEPFFTTKDLSKGTGLGLSTVYAIVQQSAGSIEVRSELGQGTEFEIYLPIHQAAAAESSSGEPLPETSDNRIRILVVEDEAPLRAVLKRLLERSGYEVFMAAESGEALDLAHSLGSTFDFVLSDVILPGMNGCELMQNLLPLCPRARHLFMSGYTDDALERFNIPRERVLPKPFDRHTLDSRIRNALHL